MANFKSSTLDRQTIERAELAAGDGPFLIALSGGGDSVALLHVMAERFGAARLRACVVDHALRPGSDEDARRAADFAQALGVAAVVARVHWAAGENHGQQAARLKRYRALCETARACGAVVLFAAHSADDQAETVLMRAGAGSSWRGLAGIAPFAPAPVWPEGRGLMLARPLLKARRADLRALLRARGAEWIEDPANANPAFERVRVRARLARLEAGGFAPLRLVKLSERLRALADEVDAESERLIARAVRFDADAALVDVRAWRGGVEARRRALSALIAAVAGATREPDAAAVERLEARFAEDAFAGATLGGAVLTRVRDAVQLTRDIGALSGRADGAAGVAALTLDGDCVWDGRLALRAREPGWRVREGAGGIELLRGSAAPVALTEAMRANLVEARWLLRERIAHHFAAVHDRAEMA